MNEPRVRITVESGAVFVVGESRDDVDVDGAPAVTRSEQDGELRIEGGSDSFTVRVPIGSAVVVGSESGDVSLGGELGPVSVTTDSADVQAEEVASIDARTRSGTLTVDVSNGPVRMKSESARVELGSAGGPVRIATESGEIVVDDARDAVALRTVSGAIRVRVSGRAPVAVETVSGSVRVAIPAGVRPEVRHRTASGRLRFDGEVGDDLVITARSVSGDIDIHPDNGPGSDAGAP